MPKTVFSKFISGELHCSKVYEDNEILAFLDQNPASKGHTLVIPKQEIDHLEDCSEELYIALFKVVRKISRRLQVKLKPMRIALVVMGTEVAHVHIHIVPLYTGEELTLAKRGDTKTDDSLLDSLASILKFDAGTIV